MSVFHKLFVKDGKKSSKRGIFCRKQRQSQSPAVIELPSKDVKTKEEPSVFVAMPPPDVRLVLFQECGETSDRRLLFDSKSFEPQKVEKSEWTIAASNHQQSHGNNNTKPRSKSYQYVRGPQDMEILSEMLFGTVGMASRASSLKIHIMKNPQRLMLSRVFCVESSKETGSLDRGMDQRPIPVLSRRKAKTLPVPTPEPTLPPAPPPPVAQSIASSLTSRITRSDSSSSLISLTQILGASLGATGSLGSRSMPQQIPSNRAHSLPPATRQASRDSFTLTQEPHNGLTSRRTKVKIGFAVIFQPEPSNTSEFQRFFFEHFPLIESYVTFLKEQVESALNNIKKSKMEFNEAMMEALQVFMLRTSSVYSTPRLARPVWSTLSAMMSPMSPWDGDDITVKCFVSELARMVNAHNTKQKNFFMSGLITSVLTHHLGWVNTTLPPSHSEKNAQTVAYNPLWAQLGDLYGAVGTPTKVAKTIVVGEIHELVSTFISILSYFIRCSNIDEVVQIPADMTPQAFSKNIASLSMSYVPSELESADYVFVSQDENFAESTDGDSEQETSKTESDTPKVEKRMKFSLCDKIRPSRSDSQHQEDEESDSTETSNGSTLCRSRSSPGTAKPSVKVLNRQKSSGTFENLNGVRLRTNSNDMFARPRGVQSRRTSHDVLQRISQSSSELAIPGCEKSDNIGSSLEGSKSLCLAPTPTSDLLRKRLVNDGMGSCPQASADSPKTLTPATPTSGQQSAKPLLLAPPRLRTHKRVSSEPFNVNNFKSNAAESTSLVKTNSTYFQPVRQTFVDRIEPKVVTVTHAQRSQPVIAMQSPVSSPSLPRSKSSAGQKGPILGFKTNEIVNPPRVTPRLKHKSGSALQDKAPTPDYKDVFSPRKPDLHNRPNDLGNSESKFDFSNTSSSVQRSSSNTSTESSERRSSSASSGKIKLANRRRKLTDSKTPSIDEEGSENISRLPPLNRIPSISLKHDDFAEYLDDETEKKEYIFFSTNKSTENHSCVSGNQSCTKNNTLPQSSMIPSKQKPPLPSVPPSGDLRNQSSASKLHPAVTEAANQKAESQPCVSKNPPPPLPSVGPCHRSQSTTSGESEKMVSPMTKLAPKSAPPIPAVPPVHHGSLYPKLGDAQNTASPLAKTSIYPNLNETPKPAPRIGGLYPNLDDSPPPYESVSSSSSLYPQLAPPSFETLLNPPSTESTMHTPQTPVTGEENGPQTLDYFSMHKKVPLCPVEHSEFLEKTEQKGDEEKRKRLGFGELMADYSPEYLWGFALHGTKNQQNFYMNVIHELQHSVSNPVLDEPVAEAVAIVADTDKWNVRVLSSHRIHSDKLALPAMNSKLVSEMLEKVMKLYQMNVPAKFCMQQLESSLGELVLKSRMLAGYYVSGRKIMPMPQLSAALGIESSDLPLLMAIASCHSPQVAAKLL